jgi:hypothetical protein
MEDCQQTQLTKLETCPDDLKVTLVFFSAFEELTLPITGPMEDDSE